MLIKYMEFADGYYQRRYARMQHAQTVKHPLAPVRGNAAQLYRAHLDDIKRIQKIPEENIDYCRADYMIAMRLRATGHQQPEIESIIATCSPMREKRGRRIDDYARITARKAFETEATYQLQKKYKKWILTWQTLEKNAVEWYKFNNSRQATIQQEQQQEISKAAQTQVLKPQKQQEQKQDNSLSLG